VTKTNCHQNGNYENRTFSESFHDFVDQCCLRDADTRQAAIQMLQHPFIKQLKKSSSVVLSLATLVSSNDLISVTNPGEDDISFDLESKMMIIEDEASVEWDF
jgi:serine/threonine protein kinase